MILHWVHVSKGHYVEPFHYPKFLDFLKRNQSEICKVLIQEVCHNLKFILFSSKQMKIMTQISTFVVTK